MKSAGTLAKIESFCRQTTYNTICLLLHHIHHLVTISHRRAHSTKHAVYQTLRWNRFRCSCGQFRNCQGIRNITDLFLLFHWHFHLMNFRITKTQNSEKLYPSVIYIYFPNTFSLVLHIQISISLFFLRLPLWSSGQSFWLQIQRSRVRFPALPDFLSSSGSGTGSTQPREVN